MGRPGWHIECSAMASEILGDSLDIHTGGIDLKFPHHDNELAQAEAYFDNNSWVRYFLHSGHLTISGCKMSKSLKNFITVKEALNRHTPRQLRLAFLLHQWKETLDYSDCTMDVARNYEKMANEFFLNVKEVLRTKGGQSGNQTYQKVTEAEIPLNDRFNIAKTKVHERLCDSIDTRGALDEIRDLISDCNIYMMNQRQKKLEIHKHLLKTIALYIQSLFRIFGLLTQVEDIGFGSKPGTDNRNTEEIVMPIVTALAEFRDEIRTVARNSKDVEVLKICDRLRDDVLPNLGVRLEDRAIGEPSAVKLADREVLLKEREEKKRIEDEKRMEKEKQRLEKEKLEQQKKIPPGDFFRLEQPPKYSQFDEKGIPTHDLDGKELSKGQMKKLQKLYQTQEKKYNDYIKSMQVNGDS